MTQNFVPNNKLETLYIFKDKIGFIINIMINLNMLIDWIISKQFQYNLILNPSYVKNSGKEIFFVNFIFF
jgi:hypothetical protein